MDTIKRFNHFGLAVESYDESIKILKLQNYKLGKAVYDKNQKIFCSLNTHSFLPPVEFLWSKDDESPIKKILENRGTSIYHLCYEINNLDLLLKELETNKIEFLCISSPKPAILFNNKEVCFYYLKGFGVVEYILI